MTKAEEYARVLRGLDNPQPYLLEHSGLPGPRGNIELALAAAEVRSGCSGVERRPPPHCWSVAVAAAPQPGRPAFEALVERAVVDDDRDLRWIARENLRKRRLERLDPEWVGSLRARLG